MREETHANYDDVARARPWSSVGSPIFPYGRQDLERAQHGHHSAPGNGVLYVFALVGRGPYKDETLEVPSTVALLIADRILSNNNNYSLPPTIAPIKVPKVVVPTNHVDGVRVSVDRPPVGSDGHDHRRRPDGHRAVRGRLPAGDRHGRGAAGRQERRGLRHEGGDRRQRAIRC